MRLVMAELQIMNCVHMKCCPHRNCEIYLFSRW